VTGGNTLLDSLPTGGRVLVIRLGAIGDVVRTIPAVRWIRETRSDVPMTWLVEPPASTLIEGLPLLDDLVILPRPSWERELGDPAGAFSVAGEAARLIVQLRRRRALLALDFQGSFKSGLLTWLSGAPTRLGFAGPFVREGAHWFYTRRAELEDPSVNRVQRNLLLAEAVGAAPGPVIAALPVGPDDQRAGRQALEDAAGSGRGPVVIVVPGSSRRQSYKRYPPGALGRVIQGLAARGARVVVSGGPAEAELVEQVVQAAAGYARALAPIGLKPLAAALAAADLYLGGDTGPMHMAWAMGTPVVAVFGPTRTDWNAPFGPGHRVVAPPGGVTPRGAGAFDQVPAEAVLEAALELLARNTPGVAAAAAGEVPS
jgi:ADP-heptose:LPS heptosyltransferase